jgi:hypothetical protein
MAGFIVRRLQAIVRKPVALFGRLVAPKPAVADFSQFLDMGPDDNPCRGSICHHTSYGQASARLKIEPQGAEGRRGLLQAPLRRAQCHEIILRENWANTGWCTHHSVMFSTTLLKSPPLGRVKFH